MRKTIPWIIVFKMLLLLVSGRAYGQTEICLEKQAIPSGYVATAQVRNPSCWNGYGIKVEIPYGGMQICAFSPVPDPYVVTDDLSNKDMNTCAGVGRYRIDFPKNDMLVCNSSPVPLGYGVTYFSKDNGNCLIGRKRIGSIFDGMLVCSIMTHIPEPYYVTWVGSGLACGGASSTYRISVARPGMDVCSQSTMHSSYVITTIGQGSSCGNGRTYTINKAHDGIYVCDNSPIPPSYVVTWRGVYATCGQLKSYRLNVIRNGMEACSGKPVPSGYVITNITSNASDCLLTDRYRLETPYEGMVACANSPIPAGWKKDGTVSIYYCSRFQGIRLSKS